IEDLFAKFLETEPVSTTEDLFQQIQTALTTHIEIEARAFYRAVRPFAAEQIDSAVKEHAAIRKILAELLDNTPTESLFASRFTELMGIVKRHIRVDEGPNGILKVARRHLNTKDLSKVSTQIRAIKRSIEGKLAA